MENDPRIVIRDQEDAESLLRIVLSGFSTVGTVLSELIFERHQREKQNRINSFIELFARELEIDLDDNKKDVVLSIEFGDLLDSVLRRVSRTSSQDKRHRFKKVLLNHFKNPISIDFTETYLDLINKLNETHLKILTEHYKALPLLSMNTENLRKSRQDLDRSQEIMSKGTNISGVIGTAEQNRKISHYSSKKNIFIKFEKDRKKICLAFDHDKYNLSENEFKFYLQDLYSKSLLYNPASGLVSDTGMFNQMEITQFGIEFIEFLKE